MSILRTEIFLFFLLMACASVSKSVPDSNTQGERRDTIKFYKHRYPLKTTNEKLVNNIGDGYEPLYGVRNFRVVLNGVAYRGGANNYYNKYGPRDNRNPLPEMGLDNLCKEGFSQAIYLYSTNFGTASPFKNCESVLSKQWNLDYQYISPYNTGIRKIIQMTYDRIHHPKKGPLYFHCWNGWHASGLTAAILLRQFCDYSVDEAIAYWDQNTDGFNTDPAYEGVREEIRKFTPLNEFQISQHDKEKMCL